MSQDGPAEAAPRPLNKGEKYRVEYPECHPHDTGLENEGHPRLRAADDADIRRCFEQQFTEGMADHVVAIIQQGISRLSQTRNCGGFSNAASYIVFLASSCSWAL